MIGNTGRAALAAGLLLVVGGGCGWLGTSSAPAPEREASLKDDASTVDAADIARDADKDIQKALAGRVSGVEVSRTASGGISVRIRGASSFYGNTQPLYILDDIPIAPGPDGSLTGLNPHDIESIKVLKDAPDTAIYGVRGANGVIVIKTKRPGRRNP
jgi:TonB-dependent SusC/RagA subfamily outer membrane receptor